MSTFKIGDRVRLKPEHAGVLGVEEGVVERVCNSGLCDREYARVTFEGAAYAGDWFTWALELTSPTPRGPRPLPIRQRVTLTAGKSLRAPARDVWSKVYTLTGPRLRDGERSWFV